MTFQQKLDTWFERFLTMKPGQSIEIAITGKRDPELFIDVCKRFIDNGNMDFEFTNDYKFFRRMTAWPE